MHRQYVSEVNSKSAGRGGVSLNALDEIPDDNPYPFGGGKTVAQLEEIFR